MLGNVTRLQCSKMTKVNWSTNIDQIKSVAFWTFPVTFIISFSNLNSHIYSFRKNRKMSIVSYLKTLVPLHIIFFYVFLTSGLIVNFIQFCTLPIWVFNIKFYRKINTYLAYMFWISELFVWFNTDKWPKIILTVYSK